MTLRLVFTGKRFEFRETKDASPPPTGDMPKLPQRRNLKPARLDGFKPLRSSGNGYRPGKLLDLGLDQCRWPTSDALFCGHKISRGSYCERHVRAAHSKSRGSEQ